MKTLFFDHLGRFNDRLGNGGGVGGLYGILIVSSCNGQIFNKGVKNEGICDGKKLIELFIFYFIVVLDIYGKIKS